MMTALPAVFRARYLWALGVSIGGAFCLAAATPAASRRPPALPQANQAPGHVFGDLDLWQWAPSRKYHVLNYRLKLRFDQVKGEVFGDETVTVRPFQSQFRKFFLDSSGLTIDAVTLERASGAPLRLRYAARDPRLWITLDRQYGTREDLRVRVVYHGFPKAGLYFVHPTPEYPQWPREIWSQGEAEFNHFWFPCWDYPNDMATSETITTVPGGQSVVSNGRLARVTRAAGEATYDWVESVPHSSYLISIAVGPWRKVSDSYHGKPVDYYVPRSVDEATARRSFHLTPDMLSFFSRATGVEYPYEQYAQTTVQNYIFGGMENVSATTLTSWTLHDQRADADYPSTDLVSHELGQHWFGDLVQGRDWANIWLNEGFATYLSALYTQYHDGYDAYRFAIYNDQLAEQAEDRLDYRRPIVDRHYTDPMQMFDATTHQKGAAVLDMMRYVIDGAQASAHSASQSEPFFQALRAYLNAHRARTADTADLNEAIRAITGQDLTWLFHEWVYMAGRPEYHVDVAYDSAERIDKVTVRQTQSVDDSTPIFDMPIELAFYGTNGHRKTIQVRVHLARQEFDVPLEFRPLWVDFDPEDFIDKTLEFDQPATALIGEAEEDPSMMSRLWAVRELGQGAAAEAGETVEALTRVLRADSFYGVRAAAAASLGAIGAAPAESALLAALAQPDSRVRVAVVHALGRFATQQAVYDALAKALHEDRSYAVQAAAAEEIGRTRLPRAVDALSDEAARNPDIHVLQGVLAGLAASQSPQAVSPLVEQAKPGRLERARLGALAGLAALSPTASPQEAESMASVAREAVHDPFMPVQRAGRRLLDSLGKRH